VQTSQATTDANLTIVDLLDNAMGLGQCRSDGSRGSRTQRNRSFTSIGDEPLLQDALSGSETSDWCDMIEVELSQVEKLWTFDLVIPPLDVNIIPSGYAFCRK